MPMIVKAFSADINVNEGERAVTATINTAAVDRDGEVVIPRGGDLKDFEKNPIVYFAHNYFDLPVGQASAIKRTDEKIVAKTIFAARPSSYPTEKEWFPDTLLSLFQQRVLRGFSIGFVPIETRPATDKDVEKFGAGVKRVFSKWKMLEYSVAPLPANQEALSIAVSKGIVTTALAQKIFDFHYDGTIHLRVELITPSTKRIESNAVQRARKVLYSI